MITEKIEPGDWVVYAPSPEPNTCYEVLAIEPIPGHATGALRLRLRGFNVTTKQRWICAGPVHAFRVIRKKATTVGGAG